MLSCFLGSGDDESIIWEAFTPMVSCKSHHRRPRVTPLICSLCLLTPDFTNLLIGYLLSSTPLLQDLTFGGTIVLWQELARAMPLTQLVRMAVTILVHKQDDTSSNFYACVQEAAMLEDLEFLVSHQGDYAVLPCTPTSYIQLLSIAVKTASRS